MADNDGNTKEILARKESEIGELKEKLEKAEGRVENAQGKIHEWEAEVGENRKAVAGAAQVMKQLGEELIAANKETAAVRVALEKALEELSGLKTKQTGPGDGSRGTPPKEDEKTSDAIEAELTAEERKMVEEAWGKASEAQRKKFKQDDAERRKFLLKARSVVKSESESDLSSPWKTPAQKPSSGDEDELDKLFNVRKKSAEFIPDGSRGGVPRVKRTVTEEKRGSAPNWI